MKKIGLLVMILVFLGLLSETAMAVPDSLSQLVNKTAYNAWALRQVDGGIAYFSGTILETNTAITYVDVSNTNGYEAVMTELNQQLSFKPANAEEDYFYSVMILRGKDWRISLSGSCRFKLEKDSSGNWVVPESALKVPVDSQNYWLYVYVGDDVHYASMGLRDSDGNQIGWEYIQVEDGWIQFAESWLGGGDLILHGPNGATGYNLREGGRMIESDLVSVPGLQGDLSNILTNVPETVGSFTLRPESYDGRGRAKLIDMKVTVNRSINFSGVTTEGEWASQIIVEDAVSGAIVNESNLIHGQAVSIGLTPGRYHIRFVWENGFDSFRPDEYGGGKG